MDTSRLLLVTVACAGLSGCAGGHDGAPTPPPPNDADPCLVQGKLALVPVPDGTACGGARVCRAGACVACVEGAPCAPSEARCAQGRLGCGATPSCVAEAGSADDGTVCGADQVCSRGTCVACVEGEVCQTGGPCYYHSRLSCAQGPMCLNQLGNFPDGATCQIRPGQLGTCLDGECLP